VGSKVTSTNACHAQVGAATTAVVDSTIEVYNQIREQLLPTPSKPHYTFNLRDVARVIQGVMRADPKTTTEPRHLTLLWLHEANRVFADRLINADDTQWFRYSVHACDPVSTCCISCISSIFIQVVPLCTLQGIHMMVPKHWQAQTQFRHADNAVALACMSTLTHNEAVMSHES